MEKQAQDLMEQLFNEIEDWCMSRSTVKIEQQEDILNLRKRFETRFEGYSIKRIK